MVEATWGGDQAGGEIDWRMSASLENVPRGNEDLAEVTSLERAVMAWQALDPEHRAAAILTAERPVPVDGAAVTRFTAEGIEALAGRLPPPAAAS